MHDVTLRIYQYENKSLGQCRRKGCNTMDKKLLSLKETCEYLNIGQTKARELIRGHNGFGVQIGNRWYADKAKLDRWIERQTA